MKRVPRTCGCLVAAMALTALSTNCSHTARANGSRCSTARRSAAGPRPAATEQPLGGQGRRRSSAPARRRCSTARRRTRTSASAPSSRSTTTATRACTSAARRPTATSARATRPRSTAPTRDPIRTGSLYTFVHVYKQLVPPDTWFTYEVEVVDKNFRGQRDPAHQGLGQRRAALRVPRPHRDAGRRAISPSSSTTRAAGSRSARSRSWNCPDQKSRYGIVPADRSRPTAARSSGPRTPAEPCTPTARNDACPVATS